MSDIITMPNGSQWLPSTATETVKCVTCDNVVDTANEIASYPDGNCPDCGNPWTGNERQDAVICVTMPQAISGET
jgi:predicted RNA-binding Zn-ribbon protein involved in translation (DUF1610 family)